MKAIASLVAGATLLASVASPALAGPVAAPERVDPLFHQTQNWQNQCYRGENYLDCQRRLDDRNRNRNRSGGSFSYGYNDGYQGGYDRDPRYYSPGGYYDQYGRNGSNGGYGGSYGYGSGGYSGGYNSGSYYGNGYGYGSNGGYYGNGYGYGSNGYGYNNGYGSGSYNNGYGYGNGYNNNDQWGGVALAVIGVALGVAILGSLDDRDHWDRYGNDRRYRDYCRDRYRSFDRNSGTYLGNDGYRHYCRWN